MKSMMKTLLVSALTIACASSVYAQGAGGGGGGGTGSGPSGGNGSSSGMGAGGNGATPGGNTLNRPSTSDDRDSGGYGSPGSTGSGMGDGGTTATPGNRSNSNSTGNPSSPKYQQ
jgi:hypothetical protein